MKPACLAAPPARQVAPYGRALLGQGLARVIFMGCGFAVFVLIARRTEAAVAGRYSLALAVFSIAIAAADFGTTTLIGAELAKRPPSERGAAFAALVAARLVAGWVAGAGLILAAVFLPPAVGWPMVLAAPVFPLAAARCFDPVFQVFGRPGWTIVLSLVYGGVLLPGTALALALSRPPDFCLAASVVAASLLYGVVGLAMAARLLPRPPRPTSALLRRWGGAGLALLRRCAPVGIANLVAMANARLGVLALSALGTPAMAGAYTAGFRFFELGAAVAVTIATPLIPIFVADAAQDAARFRRRLAGALDGALAVTLPLAAATPAIAPLVIRILYGHGFEASGPVLAVMAWMFAFTLAAMILFAALVAAGRQATALPVALMALAANAGIALATIPTLGVGGAAAGAFAAESLTLLANGLVAIRVLGQPFSWGRLLPVLLATAVIALAAAFWPSAAPALLALYALTAAYAMRSARHV